jgi:hypothetical protein
MLVIHSIYLSVAYICILNVGVVSKKKLNTFPEHLSSTPVFVTRSLVLYVCFVDCCLSFCTFLLAIVLSVLLRYTYFVCPSGIFKLFLKIPKGLPETVNYKKKQNKRTNNDLHYFAQKTKDQAIRTSSKPRVNADTPGD